MKIGIYFNSGEKVEIDPDNVECIYISPSTALITLKADKKLEEKHEEFYDSKKNCYSFSDYNLIGMD